MDAANVCGPLVNAFWDIVNPTELKYAQHLAPAIVPDACKGGPLRIALPPARRFHSITLGAFVVTVPRLRGLDSRRGSVYFALRLHL